MMLRATLLAALVALYALPAWSAGEGCDPANGWTPGTPCTPADNVGLEVSPGVAKPVQQAYDDGDFGAGGAGVTFPITTFANLGTSPCLENPGVTCRISDSESCTTSDPLETGDSPALCRWDLVQGGSPAWMEIGPAIGNDEVPITTELLEGDGFGDAAASGVTAAEVAANTAHAASTSDPHSVTAAQVSSTPSGDVAASDVDSAIAELASEKATAAALTSHTSDTSNPHTVTAAQIGVEAGSTADQVASEVPVTPTGNLSSSDVQAALEEHQADIDTLAVGGDGLGPDGDKGDITVGSSGTTLQIDAGAVTETEVDSTICKADGTDCAAGGDEVPSTSAILRGDGAGNAEASSIVWDVDGGDVSGLNAAIAACDASANGGVIQVGAGRFDFLTTAINDWGGGTTGGCEIRGQGSHSTVLLTRKDNGDGTDFWTTTHRGPNQPLKGSGFSVCAVCDAGGGACIPEPGNLLNVNPGGANNRAGRNIHTYFHDVQLDNDCGEWTSGGGVTFEGIEGDAIGTATCITGGNCLGNGLRMNHTLFGVLSKFYVYNAAAGIYTEPNAAVTTFNLTNQSRLQANVIGAHFDNSTGSTLSPKLFATDSTVEGNYAHGILMESFNGGNASLDLKGMHFENVQAGSVQVEASNAYVSWIGGRANSSGTSDVIFKYEGVNGAYRANLDSVVMGRTAATSDCQIENNAAGRVDYRHIGDFDTVNAGIVTCGTNTDDITQNGHYRLANCTSPPTGIVTGETCTDSGGTNVGVTYEYNGSTMVAVTVADDAITAAKLAAGSLTSADADSTLCQADGTNCDATQAELDDKADIDGPTFTGTVGLPDDTVTPDDVLAAGQTDELCLTYEATGDTWEWQSCTPGGGGDVTGPGPTVTDDAVVTFNGTGGLTIQESPVTIDPTTGAITIPPNATDGGYMEIAEDSDVGTDKFRLTVGQTNLPAGTTTCTLDSNGRIPDSCVGDGTDGGGSEVNDLSSVVTWANIPDANVPESAVTQHKAAVLASPTLTGTVTIPSDQVTLDDLVDAVASDTFIARDTAGGGTWEEVTAANALGMLGVEAGATADQTGAEIKTAYEAEADTNAFDDAAVSKLAGIEALADVTDATNVTAAGALMDSELADLTAVKTLLAPDNTTISTFGATLTDDVDAATARTTLDAQQLDADLTDLADGSLTGSKVGTGISATNVTTGTLPVGVYIEGGAGTDTTAIHDDTASEISAITAKATPTSADFILIEDAAAGNAKKSITIGDLPAATHASTHSADQSDEIFAENLGTACPIGQFPKSDGDGTVSCQTDDDTGAAFNIGNKFYAVRGGTNSEGCGGTDQPCASVHWAIAMRPTVCETQRCEIIVDPAGVDEPAWCTNLFEKTCTQDSDCTGLHANFVNPAEWQTKHGGDVCRKTVLIGRRMCAYSDSIKRCDGGASDGSTCTVPGDCSGGTCTSLAGTTCKGTCAESGFSCDLDSDCPPVGTCTGGTDNGNACTDTKGDACDSGGGTCTLTTPVADSCTTTEDSQNVCGGGSCIARSPETGGLDITGGEMVIEPFGGTDDFCVDASASALAQGEVHANCQLSDDDYTSSFRGTLGSTHNAKGLVWRNGLLTLLGETPTEHIDRANMTHISGFGNSTTTIWDTDYFSLWDTGVDASAWYHEFTLGNAPVTGESTGDLHNDDERHRVTTFPTEVACGMSIGVCDEDLDGISDGGHYCSQDSDCLSGDECIPIYCSSGDAGIVGGTLQTSGHGATFWSGQGTCTDAADAYAPCWDDADCATSTCTESKGVFFNAFVQNPNFWKVGEDTTDGTPGVWTHSSGDTITSSDEHHHIRATCHPGSTCSGTVPITGVSVDDLLTSSGGAPGYSLVADGANVSVTYDTTSAFPREDVQELNSGTVVVQGGMPRQDSIAFKSKVAAPADNVGAVWRESNSLMYGGASNNRLMQQANTTPGDLELAIWDNANSRFKTGHTGLAIFEATTPTNKAIPVWDSTGLDFDQYTFNATDFNVTAGTILLGTAVVRTGQTNAFGAFLQDFGNSIVEAPNGTAPSVTLVGHVGVDTDDSGDATGQFLFHDGDGTRVLTDLRRSCVTIQKAEVDDDDVPIFIAEAPGSLIGLSCLCSGPTCGTVTVSLDILESGAATETAMGGSANTCGHTDDSADGAYTAATGTLTEGDVVAVDFDTGPADGAGIDGDYHVVCASYRLTRQ